MHVRAPAKIILGSRHGFCRSESVHHSKACVAAVQAATGAGTPAKAPGSKAGGAKGSKKGSPKGAKSGRPSFLEGLPHMQEAVAGGALHRFLKPLPKALAFSLKSVKFGRPPFPEVLLYM